MPAHRKNDPLAGSPSSLTSGRVLRILPPSPLWFSPEAQDAYERIGGYLIRSGVLTEADTVLLEVMAASWAAFVTAAADYQARPLIPGYRGSEVKNPAAQIAREASDKVVAIAREFGMSPVSRGRMGVEPTPVVSALEAALSGPQSRVQ